MTTTTIELIKKASVLAKMHQGQMNEDLREIAQRLRDLDKPDCVWTFDEDGDFATQCGHLFFFDEGGIKENDCKFCQYCGGAVKDKSNEG